MIPLTVNPTVVVLLAPMGGSPLATATNVAPDIKVVVTHDLDVYRKESANKPFDTLRPETLPVMES